MKTQRELSEEILGTPSVNMYSDMFDSRSNQISRRDDTARNLTVGIHDIDKAILYYFNEVIRPTVTVNGEQVTVPVNYSSPEKWLAVQKEGIFRDREGKRQLPVILFKRDSLEKNRNITSKVDANYPQNFYITGKQRYTARNQYRRYGNLTNTVPEQAYILSVVPDYVKLTYSCIILTDYISQMNPIIEAINFASDSYWGPKDQFKFQSFVDSFKTDVVSADNDDRIIKTTFSIRLNGYIVPETVNANAYTTMKRYGKTRIRVEMQELD